MPPATAPSHATLAPGTVLSDRFEIEGVIGEGAMGVVYRAKDRAAGRPVAVKVLHKHLVQSREFLSRFKREANAASRFRHDSAVGVLGAGETEERLPYIAMDLVVGKSLKEIIASEAPLESGRAANIVSQLLRALGAAHRAGIVHRDMKPDNIRVALDDDGIERPKILDFGVAKFISGDAGEMTGGLKTKTGVVLGTPKYMAPEQIRGEAIDGRADVYSVGAMFHEMLCGKPPFEAEDVFGFVAMHLKERVVPLTERFPDLDVPESLDDIVLSMLEKDPKSRPSDAGVLADEIAKFAVEDPAAAQKERALKRGAAIVVAAGVVGAVAGVFLTGARGAQTASLGPAVATASIGLGVGAAVAARLFPRPSVYGFVKRLGVVAGSVAVAAAVAVPLLGVPGFHGTLVAFAFALTALLSYVGYLLVWNLRALALRPVVAGAAAALLATLLMPVLVAPAGRAPYFVGLLGSPGTDAAAVDAARTQSLLGVVSITLAFGLGALALARPWAARK
jgi:hypothetical protein